MTNKTVDLHQYARGVSVLAGRERGADVREREGLKAADADADLRVVIAIPDYVDSVNSSFFLGMLEDSVRDLGETKFRAKYSFTGPHAAETLEDGIRTALLMGRRFRPVRRTHRVA